MSNATDDLAAELAATKPEPSSAAPAMLAAVGVVELPPGELPAGFDPAKHETGPDGRPIPRADGQGFKLKRGRGSPNRKAPRIMATAAPAQFVASQDGGAAPRAMGPAAGDGADVEPIEVKAKRAQKTPPTPCLRRPSRSSPMSGNPSRRSANESSGH
jgi:hypothetical protein